MYMHHINVNNFDPSREECGSQIHPYKYGCKTLTYWDEDMIIQSIFALDILLVNIFLHVSATALFSCT